MLPVFTPTNRAHSSQERPPPEDPSSAIFNPAGSYAASSAAVPAMPYKRYQANFWPTAHRRPKPLDSVPDPARRLKRQAVRGATPGRRTNPISHRLNPKLTAAEGVLHLRPYTTRNETWLTSFHKTTNL